MGLFLERFVGYTKSVTDGSSVTSREMRNYGAFVVTSAGTVTLPSPSSALSGVIVLFANADTSSSTLSCTDGFVGDGDSVTVGAGQSVMVACVKVSSGTYRYCAV